MTTSAGARRHRVRLQRPGDVVPDGDGGFTEQWDDLEPAEAMAEIRPATARDVERLMAGTVIAMGAPLVTIPFHAGVTTQTRIVYGARRLAVTGVANPDERGIETVAVCSEIVP